MTDEIDREYPDASGADKARLLAQMVQARSEAQGLRSGSTNVQGNQDYLRMVPYQQDATNDQASNASQTNPDGEWFADIYVNWANGTLADNAAGDTIDGWMDTHTQDWIRMQLEANGEIPPLPTEPPTTTPTIP